jgi:hypothetical protein
MSAALIARQPQAQQSYQTLRARLVALRPGR